MGRYDFLGTESPAETRYFEGEVYELYDHPAVMSGATKRTAQKIANELRKNGNRARVVESRKKHWVYWS